MRRRRAVVVLIAMAAFLTLIFSAPIVFQDFLHDTFAPLWEKVVPHDSNKAKTEGAQDSLTMLDALPVKGRAPKTGYARTEFGNGWGKIQGCSVRQVILHRDLKDSVMKDECTVQSGVLDDPYTGNVIYFDRSNSATVQIDHVVALSDAWQKGAQNLSKEKRVELANDPLNLLASDGPANQQKGDADAATWLPKSKAFRCEYVERQVAVKYKYSLWVTDSEEGVMREVLKTC